MELRTLRSVAARMSLLLAQVPLERAEANLKKLKLSKEEIKAFLAHVKILGHLPSPNDPGQMRRYRAFLGPQQMEMQVCLGSLGPAPHTCMVVLLRIEAAPARKCRPPKF